MPPPPAHEDQAPVPPTVIFEIRTVGEPLPTGALCPSLPQTPSQVSKSDPTASTAAHHVDRASDQVGATHGRGDLTVLDQVALRDAEHEVAGRGVHLATAETAHVDAGGRVADDLRRVAGARQDVRVRHAHHGRVRVGLAARVAGRLDAHLRRAHAILQEPLQDPVGEQHRALRRRALVVEVERAPPVGDRRVVDPVDQRAGALRADQLSIHAGLLVDRVGLEGVPDRLVEQHATAAVRDDHRHLPCGCGDRVEHRHGAFRCLTARLARRVQVEELDARARGRPVPARLDHVAALGDHLREQPDARPVLTNPAAVARRDQSPLQRVEVDARDLCDLGTHAAGHLVDLAEPADLGGGVDVGRRPLGLVRPRADPLGQIDDGPRRVAREGGAGCSRRLEQRVPVQPVGVGVAVRGARAHPHAGTPVESGRQLLDVPVVEPHRGGGALLDEHLREVAAVAASGREHVGDEFPVEHGGDGNSGR